ncbi:uncharacterized protein LW93_208 [Fusarium fujikuroi]|nr:uncharacterized protein LW93_208 [Fusarium fujikuroi]
MASFRRFADLPEEIRDMIWSDASQRDLAGVQIFELRTPKPKEDGETSDITASGTRPPRQQLYAPLRGKCFPALDGGPGTSNVSRYMADIGLWTACKESREVMEKTTQRSKKILEMQAKENIGTTTGRNMCPRLSLAALHSDFWSSPTQISL